MGVIAFLILFLLSLHRQKEQSASHTQQEIREQEVGFFCFRFDFKIEKGIKYEIAVTLVPFILLASLCVGISFPCPRFPIVSDLTPYPSFFNRMSIRETVLNEGSVSELDMVSVERKDSGLYSCRASNSFGSDETSVQLVVQGLSPLSPDLRQHTHTVCLSFPDPALCLNLSPFLISPCPHFTDHSQSRRRVHTDTTMGREERKGSRQWVGDDGEQTDILSHGYCICSRIGGVNAVCERRVKVSLILISSPIGAHVRTEGQIMRQEMYQ